MRLQKRLSRKLDGKEYVKWVVTIPPQDIKKLDWKEGQTLKSAVVSKGLLLMKGTDNSYDNFKKKIQELLINKRGGMTWEEIRRMLKLEQKVPNNKMVKRLENDINLKRKREGSKTYWYIPKKDVTLFTIGYEGKTKEGFLELLRKNGIQQLIDVRELPLSRKNGFSRSTLSKFLRENGIIYKHFSALGAPREMRHKLYNDKDYETFFKEYSKYLNTEEAQEYLTDLEGLAQVRITVIMCFEKDVNVCHRSIIKDKMMKRGFRITDL